MIRRSRSWQLVEKDARALAPIWIASCSGAAFAPLLAGSPLEIIGLASYVAGSVALGAHVIGHEYAHRTLGTLLVQPVPRWQILTTKLLVLAAALATLAAASSFGPASPIGRFPADPALSSQLLFLPTLLALTLAPSASMVARSTLGGLVFTMAVPAATVVSSLLIGVMIFGRRPRDIEIFQLEVFPPTTMAICAIAAAATWYLFLRLEVVDDSGAQIGLPAIAPTALPQTSRAVRRNPYWLLAAKELRLQQMAFVVIGLYLLVWGVSLGIRQSMAYAPPIWWQPLNLLYVGVISALVGSLASAEERQFGTLEWQSLLPIAAWKQFAVKIAVVVGLVLVAGAMLPTAMASIFVHRDDVLQSYLWSMCILAVTVAAGGLYVSTLSSSGVRALVGTIPALGAGFVLLQIALMVLRWAAHAGFWRQPWYGRPSDERAMLIFSALVTCVVAVCAVLAFRNHNSIERSAERLTAQALSIAGVIAGTAVALYFSGIR